MAHAKAQRGAVAVVGLAVSAVFVALAMRHLDVASVRSAWESAHVFPWVPLAVGAYLVGHLVRGRRLCILVRRETALSLSTASNVVVVGYASNNVFPARLGELLRAGMLAERTGMPLPQSLTITFIERLFDGITILVLLLVGTSSLDSRPEWIVELARVASLVFGAALLVVFVAVFFPSVVLAAASRISARLRLRWADRVLALATSITSAGACLRRPRDAAAIAAYSVVVWLLESTMFALILPVFGLRLSLSPAMVTMAVTNLGILVPSSPGFVGPFHFFCSKALASQGVPAATAMGYAIVVHLAFYVPVTLWGAAAILWYGVQVGATAAMVRAARTSPRKRTVNGVTMHAIAKLEGELTTSRPTAFDVALTEAVLAPENTEVDFVATFLAGQMRSLAPRLRIMYAAGMAVFRLYVRLRYFRGFCRLDVERRREAVDSWAFGRLALFRQLFRPVRSTALLAFYEQVHRAERSGVVRVARVSHG